MERLKVKLIKNEKIGNFRLLIFEGYFRLLPYPGNFYMLTDIDDQFFLPRPFSVFDFKDNKIYFLVKKVGRFSNFLFKLEKNDEIYLFGPLGNKIEVEEKVIFIAGGIGFAPLYFHSKFIKDYYFFLGGKTFEDILCYKFVKENKIFVATEDGSFGYKGSIVDIFLSKMNDINLEKRKIFACGPKSMLKRIKELEEKISIPVYLYLEERMGCGFGGCKGCAILTKKGYKLLCKDGPVFDSKEVIFE